MRRDEAIAILTANQEELKRLGVKTLSLFGSVARDEAKIDSDVDVLIEWQEEKAGLWQAFLELQEHLELLLGREVDIISPKDMQQHRMRQRVFNDAVCAFPDTNCKIYQKEVVGKVPPRSWKDRILDVIEAIAKIERYTEGMAFEDFEVDELKVDAVLRNFTIIGEAARYTPPEVEAAYPDIAWKQMRGMRNVVVHEYPDVRLDTVWKIIQNELPLLFEQLSALVESEGEDS